MSDIISSAKELTTQATSDTCSDSDLATIATSIETLRDEAITIMNSTYAGRYLFGGYSTSEAPYELVSSDIGDTVTFKGDYLSLGGVVSADIDDADIETFYTANTGLVYDSLSDAATTAATAASTAATAAAASPSDLVLAAKATTAQTTSDTLAAAVTTYGGSTNLSGKLYIDEDTLTAAIASDPEAIMELFTQQATSTTSSGSSIGTTSALRTLTSSQLSTRYKEEGISYRLYDVLQKNISSIRDNAGNKGLLLEKAGAENDASEDDNTLTTLIEKYTEALEEEDRLDEFEDNLYDKYTTLETYISTMNSQLSAISSLTSS